MGTVQAVRTWQLCNGIEFKRVVCGKLNIIAHLHYTVRSIKSELYGTENCAPRTGSLHITPIHRTINFNLRTAVILEHKKILYCTVRTLATIGRDRRKGIKKLASYYYDCPVLSCPVLFVRSSVRCPAMNKEQYSAQEVYKNRTEQSINNQAIINNQ